MINRSVWYRHWMEIRGGFVLASGFAALMCAVYPFVLHGGANRYEQSGLLVRELRGLGAQFTPMGPERFFPWGYHVWVSSVAALALGFFLYGTGVRTNPFWIGHSSLYYTLSLPVSRFDLLWTRFAAGCAAILLVFGAMLVVNCAALLVMGRPIPLVPMAASSLLAAMLVLPAMAVFDVVALWNEKVALPVYSGVIAIAFSWFWIPATSFVASRSIPWNAIGVIFLIAGAALSVAGIVLRRDF
jgi:hypothetical protein